MDFLSLDFPAVKFEDASERELLTILNEQTIVKEFL